MKFDKSATIALCMAKFVSHAMAQSNNTVPIVLYTDSQCQNPSVTAKDATIELDTCTTTPALQSFQLLKIPCSSVGNIGVAWVRQIVYSDSDCRVPLSSYNKYPLPDNDSSGGVCWGTRDPSEPFASLVYTCYSDDPPLTDIVNTLNAGSPAAKPTGWAALSESAKIGIIIGAGIGALILLAVVVKVLCARWRSRSRGYQVQPGHRGPMSKYSPASTPGSRAGSGSSPLMRGRRSESDARKMRYSNDFV